MSETQPVIIKKKIKKGHGGHHGGAWKVAYADFVTAMMAFFLVLWLVSVLSVETKDAVAEYFRSYTIFKGNEAGGGKGISVMQGNVMKLDPEAGEMKQKFDPIKLFTKEITTMIEENLSAVKDQVMVFNTSQGVRLELMEMEESNMFEIGGTELLPQGEEVLKVIAQVLNNIPNKITIEGHTDGVPFPGVEYTNWELAADRANTARRALVASGLAPERILKIVSFSDRVNINPDDPSDASNRRVTIMVHAEDGDGYSSGYTIH